MSAALELRGLVAGYGGQAVVRGLDLRVEDGEVVALLGANGAGKTTTLLTAAGVLPALDGDVLLGGESLRGRPASRVARAGLRLVPEDRGLFAQLTVRENLRLAAADAAAEREALERFPLLAPLARRRAGLLSGGEQQLLALARGLAARPRVLMVDELSLGLAPRISRALLDDLRRVASERGTAVLLVEQHVQLALDVADRAYVLDRGALALTGSAAEVAASREVVEASYLGRGAA